MTPKTGPPICRTQSQLPRVSCPFFLVDLLASPTPNLASRQSVTKTIFLDSSALPRSSSSINFDNTPRRPDAQFPPRIPRRRFKALKLSSLSSRNHVAELVPRRRYAPHRYAEVVSSLTLCSCSGFLASGEYLYSSAQDDSIERASNPPDAMTAYISPPPRFPTHQLTNVCRAVPASRSSPSSSTSSSTLLDTLVRLPTPTV